MFWNPSVNLLVRMRVGGVSFVGMVFINEGIVAPLSLFHKTEKNVTTLGLLQERPVACHSPCAAARGSAGHRPGGSTAAGTGEASGAGGAVVLQRAAVARLGRREHARGARDGRCVWTQVVPGAPT